MALVKVIFQMYVLSLTDKLLQEKTRVYSPSNRFIMTCKRSIIPCGKNVAITSPINLEISIAALKTHCI